MPATSLDDVLDRDAIGQAAAIQKGEVNAAELVEAAIARVDAWNGVLNAVVTPMFDKAMATATAGAALPAGPFRGVPFLLKDVGARSEGDPYYAGMRLLRRLDFRARNDTTYVTRLRAAGLVFIGKTNTPELGLQVTTEPDAVGPTRNPWDLRYSPGGSSGGAAAAVASGMVAVAHANDVGGSIRIPASACGLVGLKPSRGRVSWSPGPPAEFHLAAEHVVTRSVSDSAAFLDVVAGWGPGDPYTAPAFVRPLAEAASVDPPRLRVGLLTTGEPDCRGGVEATGSLLEFLGHDVESSAPAILDDTMRVAESWLVAMAVEVAETLTVLATSLRTPITADDVEPLTWAMAEKGRAHSALDLADALSKLHGFGRRLTSWWDDFDILVTPTLPRPPFLLGELTPSVDDPLAGYRRQVDQVACLTLPFNVSGQPALSLPLHSSAQGLPIGIQFVARPFGEDALVSLAGQLERASPWRRPSRLPFMGC